MNYMVSTYNDTLLTIAAAVFSAPAAVVAPTEKAAEAAQRLTKTRQRLHWKHTKRKPLLSRCAADSLKTRPSALSYSLPTVPYAATHSKIRR